MTALARLTASVGTSAVIRASRDSNFPLPPRIESTDHDAERRERSATASCSGDIGCSDRSAEKRQQQHRRQRQHHRRRRDLVFLLATSTLLLSPAAPSEASIPTKNVIKSLPPGTRLRPPPPRGKDDSVSVAADAARVRQLITEAREASLERGDWSAARALYLEAFSFFSLSSSSPSSSSPPNRRGGGSSTRIASAEVARIPAALCLVELGQEDEALLELEDALAEGTPALRGSGEVHAALAALRYSLRRRGAEDELSAATAFEPRWSDERWVKEKAALEKGWPPGMVSRLVRFLELD